MKFSLFVCVSVQSVSPIFLCVCVRYQITFCIFTKIPVELTELDAFISLDFVVSEKASMNNSKIMLRLLGFSVGEVITVGRNEREDYYYSTIFESQGDIIIISLYL